MRCATSLSIARARVTPHIMPTPALARLALARPRADVRAERARARANVNADLADVERDARNAGRALVRVSLAFAVDLGDAARDGARTAREYVALPATEYNLIDPENVSRASDDANGFVVSAGRQKLLFLDVEPRGTVRVDASEEGCVQSLVDAVIVNRNPDDAKATKIIDAINASLKDLRLRNEVTATRCEDTGRASIRCQIDVWGDFREGVFARAGTRLNTILGWSLGAVMPWFLTQLAADYARWARDEPRTTAENASLASVAGKIIAGSRGKLPEGVRECECVEIVR